PLITTQGYVERITNVGRIDIRFSYKCSLEKYICFTWQKTERLPSRYAGQQERVTVQLGCRCIPIRGWHFVRGNVDHGGLRRRCYGIRKRDAELGIQRRLNGTDIIGCGLKGKFSPFHGISHWSRRGLTAHANRFLQWHRSGEVEIPGVQFRLLSALRRIGGRQRQLHI